MPVRTSRVDTVLVGHVRVLCARGGVPVRVAGWVTCRCVGAQVTVRVELRPTGCGGTGVAQRCGGALHRKFRHSSDIELRQAVTP